MKSSEESSKSPKEGSGATATEVSSRSGTSSWPGSHVFSLDLRSLALLRMVYGFLLFCDTIVRWTDLGAHYSDRGVLTRTQLFELVWNEHWFSLHLASGSMHWLNLLFLIQVLAAVALFVGWRTRLMTFLSWVLLISVHARNPMVLNGGDIYLRVILFWMLFLPWGHRWSWDISKGQGDHHSWMPRLQGNRIRGVAPMALLIQVASVYWFAALPKTDPSWTVTYSATELALRLDQFVTPLGYFFRDQFSGQLALLTFLVISWEMLGPFLLFFPFDRGQVRTLTILGFMMMHIGFGSLMELGFFAWIGTSIPVMLLPSWFWDRPCAKIGLWADARFGSDQSHTENSGWKFPREFFFLFLALYCFLWNANNEKILPNLVFPKNLTWFGHMTRLDQRWNMFSPGPLTEDGWFVIEGRFKHGVVSDLFQGGKPLVWDKPKDVAHTYKNQRWRKYMMNLWLAENQKFRGPYGMYLCRKWNRSGRGPAELASFDIIYMLENTNLDGSESTPERREIWKHWCFDAPKKIDQLKGMKPRGDAKPALVPLRPMSITPTPMPKLNQ